MAEDLVQEALIHAIRVAKGMRGDPAARTWLIAIAFNRIGLMLPEPMTTFGPLAELCDHGPSSKLLQSSHKRPFSAVYGWVFSMKEVSAAMKGR